MAMSADAASRRPVRGEGKLRNSLARESVACRLLSLASLSLVVSYLVSQHGTLVYRLRTDWKSLLLWVILIVLVNLFPVWLGDITFTLDMPLLLALALLYPPVVATFTALVGSLDIRELRGGVAPFRAVFNRAQVALGVLAAAWVFRSISSGLEPWTIAVFATLVAIAVSYLVNVFLVSTYTHLRQHIPIWGVVQSLTRGRLVEFAATYAGYCGLAIVLAYLFRDVGGWSVVLFLIPTIVAQQMLVRGQRLQAATEQLKGRERLLERSFERIVDERRDERVRIAGELHDEVLGTLTKILMQAKGAKRLRYESRAQDAELGEVVAEAERSVSSLRDIISDLQKSPLGRGGLLRTLRGLIQDLRLDWNARIHFRSQVATNLQPETQVLAYQVAREALMNALKHSEASQIWVNLSEVNGELVLDVIDNGTGFEQSEVDTSLHFGLGLMKERIRLASGTLSLESTLGRGTHIRAKLPVGPPKLGEEWIRRARKIPPAGLQEDTERLALPKQTRRQKPPTPEP
jgi:signal transduction histidine kinase